MTPAEALTICRAVLAAQGRTIVDPRTLQNVVEGPIELEGVFPGGGMAAGARLSLAGGALVEHMSQTYPNGVVTPRGVANAMPGVITGVSVSLPQDIALPDLNGILFNTFLDLSGDGARHREIPLSEVFRQLGILDPAVATTIGEPTTSGRAVFQLPSGHLWKAVATSDVAIRAHGAVAALAAPIPFLVQLWGVWVPGLDVTSDPFNPCNLPRAGVTPDDVVQADAGRRALNSRLQRGR